jgi:DNA modification methylase
MSGQWFPLAADGSNVLWVGDCREMLALLPEACIDAIVCDPPYELGFMGKAWDSTGVAFDPETWRACLRVLKPGGHLIAFAGSRTYHRITVAVEDGGFEIRDELLWLYGTGFPKGANVAKNIDKKLGVAPTIIGTQHRAASGRGQQGEGGYAFGEDFKITRATSPEAARFEGWDVAMKPGHEPAVLARKPLAGTIAENFLAYGVGGLNIGACRVGEERRINAPASATATRVAMGDGWRADAEPTECLGRWPSNVILSEEAAEALEAQAAGASKYFYVVKPNRRERDLGLEAFPVASAGEATGREEGSDGLNSPRAGAGRSGGGRNIHPTVKPVELMEYLTRLVCPPGGLVLDPFAGSGTTGMACAYQGFRFIGAELEMPHAVIAAHRIQAALAGRQPNDHKKGRR